MEKKRKDVRIYGKEEHKEGRSHERKSRTNKGLMKGRTQGGGDDERKEV